MKYNNNCYLYYIASLSSIGVCAGSCHGIIAIFCDYESVTPNNASL